MKFIVLILTFAFNFICLSQTNKNDLDKFSLNGEIKTITEYEVIKGKKHKYQFMAFNSSGYLIDWIVNYDDNKIIERELYRYNDSNLLIRRNIIRNDVKIIIENSYNELKKLIKVEYINDLNQTYSTHIYTYNSSQNLLYSTKKDSMNQLISRSYIFIDTINNIKKLKTFDSLGLIIYEETYRMNTKDDLIQYSFLNGLGDSLISFDNKYNPKGVLEKTTFTDWTTLYSYKYKKGNWLKKTEVSVFKTKKDSTINNYTRKIKYYK